MKVWAYIHPQLNILCCAVLPEAVPEGVKAIELEVETVDDVIYDGTQIRLKTVEEKLQEEKERKLQELKQYVESLLAQTDYVVIKFKEAEILGQDTIALKEKYADALARRQAIRNWNEKTKQAIKEAKTLEELKEIKIEFEG